MICDLDIWRCAQLMINNHGAEAGLEAATTADEWRAKGNTEAQRVWMRIASAIEALQTARPGETKQWCRGPELDTWRMRSAVTR